MEPERIDRRTLQRLIADDQAQVVEVLGRAEFQRAHLPGALHLWLPELDRRASSMLDPDRPVAVYCNDFL